MKVDQFRDGRWRTQYHSELFVSRFIYTSQDFENGTTLRKENDTLIFELNGKEKALYLLRSGYDTEIKLSINQAVLLSIGLNPDKNLQIEELKYVCIVDSYPVDNIPPLFFELNNRQDALIDRGKKLRDLRRQNNTKYLLDSLNRKIYFWRHLLQLINKTGNDVYNVNPLKNTKRPQAQCKNTPLLLAESSRYSYKRECLAGAHNHFLSKFNQAPASPKNLFNWVKDNIEQVSGFEPGPDKHSVIIDGTIWYLQQFRQAYNRMKNKSTHQ